MKLICRSSLALIALLGLSAPVHAEEWISYPGTMCRSTSTSAVYSGVKICNASSSTLTVYCPVVRDVYNSNIDDSWVYVVDNHTSSNVSCTLVNANYTTGSTVSSANRSTSTYGYSPVRLSLGALSTSGTDVTYLNCSLPPSSSNGQSCVVSYGVNE